MLGARGPAAKSKGPGLRKLSVATFGCIGFTALALLAWSARRRSGVGGFSPAAMVARPVTRIPEHDKLDFYPMKDPESAIGELRQQGTYLLMAGVDDASFWHTPPQLAMDRDQLQSAGADHQLATFVCEIPAGTRAKFEVLKPEPLNPIVQDVKAGRVREYPMPLGVTYGALTQTYEHPNPDAGRDAFTGLAGDGDPVDAVDLSSVRGTGGGAAAEPLPLPRTGDVYPVRVIGAIAMVDGGEADWKVVTVRSDDPLLGGVTDVMQLLPRRRVISHAELMREAPAAAALVASFEGAPARHSAGKGDGGDDEEERAEEAAAAERARDLPPGAQAEGRARLDDVVRFFASYKKANPLDDSEPSPVSFAFGGRFLDAQGALAVVAQGYRHWCALVRSAMAAAQAAADPKALGRAREHVVKCRRVLRQRRLPEDASALPLPEGVWV